MIITNKLNQFWRWTNVDKQPYHWNIIVTSQWPFGRNFREKKISISVEISEKSWHLSESYIHYKIFSSTIVKHVYIYFSC